MFDLKYLPGVVTLMLDVEKCNGCGTCLAVCPHAVLIFDPPKVRINDRDACMECGACARNCSTEAITVIQGVGCAAAVIQAKVGSGKSSCCCTLDNEPCCRE